MDGRCDVYEEYVLRDTDAVSMAQSLEIRGCALLRHVLVEFVGALRMQRAAAPIAQKAHAGGGVGDLLTPEILRRGKGRLLCPGGMVTGQLRAGWKLVSPSRPVVAEYLVTEARAWCFFLMGGFLTGKTSWSRPLVFITS